MKRYWSVVFVVQLIVILIVGLGDVYAGGLPSSRVSDVRNTKHNLGILSSSGPTRTVQANSDEDEICVFCHTPHGATTLDTAGPLWNRQLSAATYTTYNSGSLDATAAGVALDQPNGISKLCLSCHDGTIAIGNMVNRSGSGGLQASALSMNGVETDGTMPAGPIGENTGFTRRIGTDLSNDHPISFTFDTALANADGELRDPAVEAEIGNRGPGVNPTVPLDNDQVQCNSCHDPHIRDAVDPTINIKFLRLNRFQKVSPIVTTFNQDNDIICLACHDKAGWVGSAHATDIVANETYTATAATLREFPEPTQVWESACLACHDTHTVQGSRRLLREGVDGAVVDGVKQGGNPAIEQTCFACHSSDGGTLTAQGLNTEVPDIKSDFSLARHMPIANYEQVAGTEKHDIGTVGSDAQELTQRGKDFIESRASMGKISLGGSLNNRHVECTDCHNPHRVMRRRLFNEDHLSNVVDSAGTHAHDIADITAETPYVTHNNIASGVLRGTFGVEPVYASNDFFVEPSSFTVKRGDPGTPGFGTGTTNVTEPYVTREYQICLKCHSNYAYDEPPMLGASSATTPSGTNGMTQYTNQAQEYNSPVSHQGQAVGMGVNGGAGAAPFMLNPTGEAKEVFGPGDPALKPTDWNTNNHRGWHPVMRETGRTAVIRNANANNWTAPFNAAVGTQTMYCSDCHGSNTPIGTADPDGAGYENGAVWGPHGSTNNFILKGPWSGSKFNGTGELEGSAGAENHLCFKCHEFDEYANGNAPSALDGDSGFGGNSCTFGCGADGIYNNLHRLHAYNVSYFRCNLCHVAVPHGWKNKAFLVNLNDVGPEAGFSNRGNEMRLGQGGGPTLPGYTKGPYYNRAAVKIISFAKSGEWSPANCGSAGGTNENQLGYYGSGMTGVNWMMSDEGCMFLP